MYSVIVSILGKLNANVNLKALCSIITPFSTDEVNTAYYKAVKLASDAVTGQIRFELTAICSSYPNSIKAIAEAEKTLLTLGDNQLSDDILTVTRNGGASMKNEETQTYHETAMFTITYRERI